MINVCPESLILGVCLTLLFEALVGVAFMLGRASNE